MGAIQTTGNGQVVRAEKPTKTLLDMVQERSGDIAEALPKHLTKERMARVMMTALRTNRELLACTPASFFGCMMAAAQIGLEVNTPLQHAWLIPRKAKDGGKECTLQIGYQGFMDLARRSGEIASIYAEAVYPGDVFEYELGLERKLRHLPSGKEDREVDEKKLTNVYAVARLKGGEAIFVVLTRAQVEKYRKRGSSRSFSPWDTDYEAMAKKTAIRRLFTYLPRSAEVASAISADEALESNRPQVVAFSPEISEALEAQGFELPTETGEAPMREPGDED